MLVDYLEEFKVAICSKESVYKKITHLILQIIPGLYADLHLYSENAEIFETYRETIYKLDTAILMCFNPDKNAPHSNTSLRDLYKTKHPRSCRGVSTNKQTKFQKPEIKLLFFAALWQYQLVREQHWHDRSGQCLPATSVSISLQFARRLPAGNVYGIHYGSSTPLL